MKTNIGGLVGNMNGGKIVNSHAEGAIFINGSATNVGGLVGSMDGGEIDNSTSNMRIISTEDNVFNVFNDLRIALEQIDKSDVKQSLIQLVNDMEKSVGKTTFTEKYKNFMSNAADHITVATPIVTKLAEYLI
ncbi:GLUG motif-containing protein [Lysinibacillus capsici]|uniref:GLUG motif-containing protein n=1 Tax=Lysinibacillus capsici TaxID=2115968 RepID=UPI00325FD716